jgi:hypothetical protein
MNERIKQLAEQCWNKRPEDQLHFDNEKFADMIVRECSLVADRAHAEDMGWNIGEIIKEHFGVEE